MIRMVTVIMITVLMKIVVIMIAVVMKIDSCDNNVMMLMAVMTM